MTVETAPPILQQLEEAIATHEQTLRHLTATLAAVDASGQEADATLMAAQHVLTTTISLDEALAARQQQRTAEDLRVAATHVGQTLHRQRAQVEQQLQELMGQRTGLLYEVKNLLETLRSASATLHGLGREAQQVGLPGTVAQMRLTGYEKRFTKRWARLVTLVGETRAREQTGWDQLPAGLSACQ